MLFTKRRDTIGGPIEMLRGYWVFQGDDQSGRFYVGSITRLFRGAGFPDWPSGIEAVTVPACSEKFYC